MTDKLVELTARYWRVSLMRWIAPVGAAVVVLVWKSGGGSEQPTTAALGLAAAAALAIRLAWGLSNRPPRNPSGRVGFVVAITTESEQHEKQLRSDFLGHLRKAFDRDKELNNLHLIELPQWLSERIQDQASAMRILGECKAHVIVYGAAKKRVVAGRESHLLELDGLVRHFPIPKTISNQLGLDFRAALPAKTFFPIDNDTFAFAATSEWMDTAVRYVLGFAALVSGDVRYAERMLLSVEERLKGAKHIPPHLLNVARKLPQRIVEVYSAWLNALFDRYFANRDRSAVEESDRIAQLLLKRQPQNYQAQLVAAIGHFVLRRDIRAAKQAAYSCRRVRDQTWRYSYAFLLAYEGQVAKAREQYGYAFNGRLDNPTVPVQVEEFIQLVLVEEPQMVQLHFFSGLVNLRAKGDRAGARADFETFISKAGTAFPEEIQLAKDYLREIDRLEETERDL